MLKKIGSAIGVLVVLAIALIATRPATYSVVRRATIAASPETVHSLVNDFHRWSSWAPWDRLDPNMNRSFTGPAAGPGAVYAWSGNRKVGEGRMKIVAGKPGALVEIELEFFKPYPSTTQVLFELRPLGSGTEVSWTMSGRNDFVGKAMMLFTSWDSMIGPDFEEGLANLKVLAEGEEKQRAAAEAARRAAEEAARRAAEEAARAAAADGGTPPVVAR